MKKIRSVIIVMAVILAAFFYAHVAKKTLLYDKHADSSDYVGYMMADDTVVRQTFTTKEKTLDGIYLKLTTSGDVADAQVSLTLLDKESGVEVAHASVPATTIRSGRFSYFGFEEGVEDCRGKTYEIQVQAQGTDAYHYVTSYYHLEEQEGNSLTIGQDSLKGRLIARTVTCRFDVETYVITLAIVGFMYAFLKLLYALFR